MITVLNLVHYGFVICCEAQSQPLLEIIALKHLEQKIIHDATCSAVKERVCLETKVEWSACADLSLALGIQFLE